MAVIASIISFAALILAGVSVHYARLTARYRRETAALLACSPRRR